MKRNSTKQNRTVQNARKEPHADLQKPHDSTVRQANKHQENKKTLKQKLAEHLKEPTGFLEAVGVVILLIGVFINFNLWFAQLRSNATSQENLVASNRAWLYPENFHIAVADQGGQIILTVNGDNQNVGHSPALYVLFSNRAEYGVIPINSPDPKNFDIPNDDLCASIRSWIASQSEPPFSATVFPNEKLSYERSNMVPPMLADPEQDMTALQTGGLIYFWRDCVAYKTFGQINTSAFCFYSMRDPVTQKLTTYHCAHGNEAN